MIFSGRREGRWGAAGVASTVAHEPGVAFARRRVSAGNPAANREMSGGEAHNALVQSDFKVTASDGGRSDLQLGVPAERWAERVPWNLTQITLA